MNLKLQKFSFLYLQTLYNDCAPPILCTFYKYFLIFRGVDFLCHPSTTFLGCLVCVICNPKFSFHYIQTMYNNCSHIEDVHLLFHAHFMNIFLFWGVLNLDIIASTPPLGRLGCLPCVICV